MDKQGLIATPLVPDLETGPEVGRNRIRHVQATILACAHTDFDVDEVRAHFERRHGMSLPLTACSTVSGTVRAIRTATDQVLVLDLEGLSDEAPSEDERLYVVDQGDAWVVFRMEGPDTLEALRRMTTIELDVLAENAAARTQISHIGTIIVREDRDRFLLLTPRSFGRDILRTATTSLRHVMP